MVYLSRQTTIAVRLEHYISIASIIIASTGFLFALYDVLPFIVVSLPFMDIRRFGKGVTFQEYRRHTVVIFSRAIAYLCISLYVIINSVLYSDSLSELMYGCGSATITTLCLVFDILSVAVRVCIVREMTRLAKSYTLIEALPCSAAVA